MGTVRELLDRLVVRVEGSGTAELVVGAVVPNGK
jgi:hypothetical protein